MSDDDNIPRSCLVIPTQPETAVYTNTYGQIVVRQQVPHADDAWIICSIEHVPALIAAIEAAAISPGAGFRQLDDEPEAEPQPIEESRQPAPIDDRRELVRAALLAGGKSDRQIARELGVGATTVRRIRQSLTAPDCATSAPPTAPGAPMAHLFSLKKEEQAA